ncbi:MAG TPA: ATP-binding protein [Rhodanobacter sp.]
MDDRISPFIQTLLLFAGIALPLNKAYALWADATYWRAFALLLPSAPHVAFAVDLGTDAIIVAGAWTSLYLIRLGHFHQAIGTFIGAILTAGLLAYGTFGFWVLQGDFYPVIVLALGGLILSRRALTVIYLVVILQFVLGMSSDMLRHPHAGLNMGENVLNSDFVQLPMRIVNYLLVVLIIDRTGNALRKSLAESDQRRQQLHQEMIEREQAQEQLLHAQKMDAVGKLASGIAHDFNNVLGIILGFALERHRLDEPGADRSEDALALATAMHGMEMAARRGASVSRQLLNFSRLEVTHEETFDAAEALRELQPLLRQLLPAPIRLNIDTSDEPLPIRFDRSQFELALLNLASNARDAMPDGGTLDLTAAAIDASNLCIRVRDNGRGMGEDVKRRIFEPFYTTKPAGSGTGLGLTVIYGLVERTGGHIDVESAPGVGTTLLIHLPITTHAFAASRLRPTCARYTCC